MSGMGMGMMLGMGLIVLIVLGLAVLQVTIYVKSAWRKLSSSETSRRLHFDVVIAKVGIR